MSYEIDASKLIINGKPANKRSIKHLKKALKAFAPKPGEPTFIFIPENATPSQVRPAAWAEIEAERLF